MPWPDRPIGFHVTTRVWLSLERFTNAGLDQQRIIEIIKSMPDAGSNALSLRAEEMRVNHNVIVETNLTDWDALELMVERIQRRLEEELNASR